MGQVMTICNGERNMARLQNVQFSARENTGNYVVSFDRNEKSVVKHYAARDSKSLARKDTKPEHLNCNSVREFNKMDFEGQSNKRLLVSIDAGDDDIKDSTARKMAELIRDSECIVSVRLSLKRISIGSFETLVETRKLQAVTITE